MNRKIRKSYANKNYWRAMWYQARHNWRAVRRILAPDQVPYFGEGWVGYLVENP